MSPTSALDKRLAGERHKAQAAQEAMKEVGSRIEARGLQLKVSESVRRSFSTPQLIERK
jgi:hypothetical protein